MKVFIEAKLKNWDKDKNGCFDADEVQAACDEMRGVMDQLASLKWTIIICSVGLALLLVLVLGAGAIAIAVTKEIKVGSSGQLTKIEDGSVVVTTQVEGVDDSYGVHDFDSSDNWALNDTQIRDLQGISFTDANGVFYHEKIAQLKRFDSGPSGSTDQVEILTEAGHQLRFFEANDFGLEVKWADQPNMQWTLIVTPSRRLQESSERRLQELTNDPGTTLEDLPELQDLPPEAPARLLSKGGYVGGVYVHSRGGGGNGARCDPTYIEGQQDPSYYCDSAQHLAGFSNLFLVSLIPLVAFWT